MCAILDTSVVHKVFGDDLPEAGGKFFEWLNAGKGKLVGGGRLLQELEKTYAFREWLKQALLAGRAVRPDDHRIGSETRALERAGSCQSNDPHVIAVARISGARFLYSDDQALQRDFKDRTLIDKGIVYSTVRSDKFNSTHWRLLGRRYICKT